MNFSALSSPANADLEATLPSAEVVSSLSVGGFQGCPLVFAGSWDGRVRVWEVQKQTSCLAAKAEIPHPAPVLAVSATSDGRVFTGCCDRGVRQEIGGAS
eukprot:RCo040911